MDVRELRRALQRKLGADEDRRSHHVFLYVRIDQSDIRAAKFSDSQRGQLAEFIVSDTARRLRLSRAELNELVDCPMDQARFLRLWRSRGA